MKKTLIILALILSATYSLNAQQNDATTTITNNHYSIKTTNLRQIINYNWDLITLVYKKYKDDDKIKVSWLLDENQDGIVNNKDMYEEFTTTKSQLADKIIELKEMALKLKKKI